MAVLTDLFRSEALKHRASVSGLFLLNGIILGCWAPAIPAFKDKHALTESELGLMILAVGIGSLMTMPVTGFLIAKRGSTLVLKAASIVCVFLLPAALLAPSVATAALVLFIVGGGVASMDVAMNSNAVRVEERYNTPIMSSCHGFWSLGALLGTVIGGFALGQAGLIGIAAVSLVILAVGVALLLPILFVDLTAPETDDRTKTGIPLQPILWVFAIMAFAGFTAEGSILDWAALYLRDERGLAPELAGYAFGAFSGMMAIVRFVGDPIRARLGDSVTLILSALIATIGFYIAGLVPSQTGAIVGFAVVGLGLANIIPIAFSAAEQIPGVAKGVGMAVATTCGYSGLLLAPPLIGFVAETTDFATIFVGVAFLPGYVLLAALVIAYGSKMTTSTRRE